MLYYIDKELLVPLQAMRLGEQHDNFPVFAKYNVPRPSHRYDPPIVVVAHLVLPHSQRLLHEARANVRSPPSYSSTNLTMATVVEVLAPPLLFEAYGRFARWRPFSFLCFSFLLSIAADATWKRSCSTRLASLASASPLCTGDFSLRGANIPSGQRTMYGPVRVSCRAVGRVVPPYMPYRSVHV